MLSLRPPSAVPRWRGWWLCTPRSPDLQPWPGTRPAPRSPAAAAAPVGQGRQRAAPRREAGCSRPGAAAPDCSGCCRPAAPRQLHRPGGTRAPPPPLHTAAVVALGTGRGQSLAVQAPELPHPAPVLTSSSSSSSGVRLRLLCASPGGKGREGPSRLHKLAAPSQGEEGTRRRGAGEGDGAASAQVCGLLGHQAAVKVPASARGALCSLTPVRRPFSR